ncbi:MAG: hypothetical protein QGD90_00205 [Candidatus Hydrogenedentes bacterium]|nr:hypothetical protein [Candidatus Hydrogenedentota bacterium]
MAEPLPTVDLGLDVTTNDLVFTGRNLTTVSGAALVAQRLKVILQLFKGEWFLDADAGIPWFQEILEKGVDVTVVDAILRAAILGVTDVNRLLIYSSEIDAAARTISVAFTVDTVYGPVVFEGALL